MKLMLAHRASDKRSNFEQVWKDSGIETGLLVLYNGEQRKARTV